MTFEYLEVKIWLSQEQKDLSERNKKHFSLFLKYSLLDIKKQTSKNVADTTFKCILLRTKNFRNEFGIELDWIEKQIFLYVKITNDHLSKNSFYWLKWLEGTKWLNLYL